SGCRRCRAPGRVAFRVGASLSVASDHDDRAVPPWRVSRRDWAHRGRGHAGFARSIHHHRECRWRERQHRYRSSRPHRARRVYFGPRHWNTHVGNAVTYALQYDVVNDFGPIALLADAPLLLVAKKAIPANDLKELIAWLKANPDKASMGTVGAGSPGHL